MSNEKENVSPATDLREENERKPMDLNITKEWFEKRAALEGDHEIGAGIRKTMTLNLTPEEIAELERLTPNGPELQRLREENERLKALLADFLPPKVEWKERDVDSVLVHHKLSLIKDARAYLRDGTLPATTAEEQLEKAREALKLVRSIIVDSAKAGFNPLDSGWAARLYLSQGVTSATLQELDQLQDLYHKSVDKAP